MAGRELSREPKHVRNRLRRGTNRERDLEMLGYKPVSEWDVEELAKGRPRDRNGSFRGHSPSWITPAVQAEAAKRFKENVFGELMARVPQAVKVLEHILTSTEVDDNGRPVIDAKTKLDAAKFLTEHAIGKAMQRTSIEINPVDPVQQALSAAIVLDDGRDDSHLTIEGSAYWRSLGGDPRFIDQDEARFVEDEVRRRNGAEDDEDESPFELITDEDD